MIGNGWLRMIAENPGHSDWYIERFRSMGASGHDLDGEARFVDAIAPRQARSWMPAAVRGVSVAGSPPSDTRWSVSTSIRR